MKYVIALFSLVAFPVLAADAYVEMDYNAIWDDLDQDVSSVGAGIAFTPVTNLMIDVGADYIVNNDISHSGHIDTADFSRKEDNRRIYHNQYEDDWMLGVKLRYNFWSF